MKRPRDQADDTPTVGLLTIALVVLLVALIGTLTRPDAADARWSNGVIATWYGPGFYGNRTACGQQLTTKLRGVAHRTLPCGAWLTLRHGGRRVRVRIIDRGPYSGATLDLTARTAQDLCRCSRPYTMRVRMRRGRH